MQNFSHNWQHLYSLLTGYSISNSFTMEYSLKSHLNAKALALFLANATLATAKLSRVVVEDILSGKLQWPREAGPTKNTKTDLPITYFENKGFISFYGDWLSVHFRPFKERSEIDESLRELVDSLYQLYEIKYGQSGFIRPFYKCEEGKLRSLFLEEFGHDDVSRVIQHIDHKNGYFELHPNKQLLDSLVSSYLWKVLNEMMSIEDAFDAWMLCMRVNCDSCFPILFNDTTLNLDNQIEFKELLLKFIEDDKELKNSLDKLPKQAINHHDFVSRVIPVSTQINFVINLNDGSSNDSVKETVQDKVTFHTLENIYPKTDLDQNLSHLQFIKFWQEIRHSHHHEMFYAALISKAIASDIHFQYQTLGSFGFTQKLLDLAKDRPILRYFLLVNFLEFKNYEFKLYLLSRTDTCDVGLNYLCSENFSQKFHKTTPHSQQITTAFQSMICEEFIHAIENDPDCGSRLYNTLDHLGSLCSFSTERFTESNGYNFLVIFLDNLPHDLIKQLGEAFVTNSPQAEVQLHHSYPRFHIYFLGFWLIQQIDKFGLDISGSILRDIKSVLLDFYIKEFEVCVEGKRTLEPNAFFVSLPWTALVDDENVAELLKLSSDCYAWKEKLKYEKNDKSYVSAWAIRHYLSVLINIARSKKLTKSQKRVENRILEIVKILGFGNREEGVQLFDHGFIGNRYDLWPQLCLFSNQLDDDLFQDFLDSFKSSVTLDRLFDLLERTTVDARAKQLKEAISTRSLDGGDEMALQNIENSFLSAWRFDELELSRKLFDMADHLLNRDRFARSKSVFFTEKRNLWLVYGYKLQLWELHESLKDKPNEFSSKAAEIPNPFKDATIHSLQYSHQKDCDRFRRYFSAAAHLDSDPQKSVDIAEALCNETDAEEYIFILFKARLKLHQSQQSKTGEKYALTQFLNSVTIQPNQMRSIWVSTVLDAFGHLLDRDGLNEFWSKLSSEQKCTLGILVSYCKACRDLGEIQAAIPILVAYQQLNPEGFSDSEIEALLNEFINQSHQVNVTQVIAMVAESFHRNIEQLRIHYNSIIAKDFAEYLEIIKPNIQPHEFLKDIVREVVDELLLRKTNLLIHDAKNDQKIDIRITKEDLINDWFTSLFDKRMAETGIGLRDQKRGGQSPSGDEPGRIDGYIAGKKNRRYGIFEAFRLFSMNTTVIDDHLNKIAEYDNECLSPVFIVAYCDITEFDTFVTNYTNHISTLKYEGFTFGPSNEMCLKQEDKTNNLWLGKETRLRGDKEIILYHVLINLGSNRKLKEPPQNG